MTNKLSNQANKDDILGKGWSFPLRFSQLGKCLSVFKNEEVVESSITLILSTVVGERMANPKFGSDLQQLMYSGVNRVVTREIAHRVRMALLEHEPRIDVHEVSVRNLDETKGVVEIHLAYVIRTTNTRYNLVYPLYLEQASL